MSAKQVENVFFDLSGSIAGFSYCIAEKSKVSL
jgi:hypothetical protein